LAALGEYYVAPNPMVGAVLAAPAGSVLAEGWHRAYGGPHAEVRCFEDAERRGVTEAEIHEATLYVSLEPCSHYGKTPPCAELILRKRPKRVVVGMLDPNPLVSGHGVQMLRDAGIEVVTGVLEQACRRQNKRFLCLMEQHRPYVILKWAQTKDGFIDSRVSEENGPLIISSPVTKQLVHKMRAENMAILVGARTVEKDHPRLRTTHWAGRDPQRIALDHHPEGKDYEGWLVYSENTEWPFVLADLAKRNIHSVLVEGGATVLNHILASGVYDEVHVEVSEREVFHGVEAPKWEFRSCLAKNLCIEKYEENTIYMFGA
jgi:diaminohydroxyphosphoribosylaminopyrimidine deaminase/5-amino-6-(5-phosphoribosylamino)uracil reductase